MEKINKDQIIESLKTMTIVELNDLVKAIEVTFDVKAAAPVAAASGPAASAAPTEVTVRIIDAGPNKVNVIKIYRELTGLGLMEAKKAVDNVPAVVKEGIKLDEADTLKKKLEEAGAKVEVK
ncbi:unnamed protein product [Didymodactylos carnosus]|uniref:50S ribosomal protein L7/L12 n=1 Tax=Didymodactylos carnosus TaxID=1234261 RepID=A0A8S2CRC4_9BILA|nr:unnamed protein product [Didymodactylos carnosus]CAF3496307.1 unnamed protein product [Didymodactylos carnosus]